MTSQLDMLIKDNLQKMQEADIQSPHLEKESEWFKKFMKTSSELIASEKELPVDLQMNPAIKPIMLDLMGIAHKKTALLPL